MPINEHPQITTTRILIELGDITSFTRMFHKDRLTIKALADATGTNYPYLKKRINDPLLITLKDIVRIADALGIDGKKLLLLIWADVTTKK